MKNFSYKKQQEKIQLNCLAMLETFLINSTEKIF
jgi:hypothetical protein